MSETGTDQPTPSLFERDGDAYVPTEWCRSPWDPRSSHGGPMVVLAARAAETAPSLVPVIPTRLSLDLLGPVPLGEAIEPVTRVVRDGKRLQLLETDFIGPSGAVATSRVLRIRSTELELPPDVADREGDRTGPKLPPEPAPSPPRKRRRLAYNNDGVDFVDAERTFGEGAGPNQMWTRLAVPVIADEPPTPFERLAAAADFGNGMSSPLPFEGWLFINTDVTLFVDRLPASEWIHLDAVSMAGAAGSGSSTTRLCDVHGLVGSSRQSLLIDEQRR